MVARSVVFVHGCIIATALGGWPVRAHAQAEKFDGEWRLNPAKSSSASGQVSRSGSRTYEHRGDGIVVGTRQGIDAAGQPYFSQYAVRYDGKDYPSVLKGSGAFRTIAFTRVDDWSASFVMKQDGKITANGTTAISKDGNTITVTTTSVNATKPGVEVYERTGTHPAPPATPPDMAFKIAKWKGRVNPPAEANREYEDRGAGFTLSTRQSKGADGRASFSQYAARYDGKDYPRFVLGAKSFNTIALGFIDRLNGTITLKEDGKLVSTGTTKMSGDGKVLTIETKSLQTGNVNTEVYDRR
jgi:hypothetical protein